MILHLLLVTLAAGPDHPYSSFHAVEVANDASVAPVEARHDLDLRDDRKQATPRFIVFFSRKPGLVPPSPGHAFIVLGYEDASLGVCGQEGWGFYPTDDATKSVFRQVPGAIVNELVKNGIASGDVGLSCRVTDKQWDAATATLTTWKAKDLYKLREQDCVSFVGTIARALDLYTPDRGRWNTKLPYEFVADIASENTESSLLTGVWEYRDDKHRLRFRLVIEGARCEWIDSPAEGAEIKTTLAIASVPRPFDLLRSNTDDVLVRLGYSDPALRAQILARSPQASRLSVQRSGGDIKGRWQGLLITKTPQNTLKDISFPQKDITFSRVFAKS